MEHANLGVTICRPSLSMPLLLFYRFNSSGQINDLWRFL
jgi:hypothetical protein